MINKTLLPLSSIYGLVIKTRNWAYDKRVFPTYKSSIKIVCVGNITVGGNGKSPAAQQLCRELQNRDMRPVLLLRGYGGRLKGPIRVKKDHTPQDVGDEACMHLFALDNVPIVIAAKRVEGAKFIEREKLGDLIVLDDGFQHRALDRDVNLVLFDKESMESARNEPLLPAGTLREPLFRGLSRADGIILVERCGDEIIPKWSIPGTPIFKTRIDFGRAYDLNSHETVKLDSSLLAVASIAKPDQFIQLVDREGGPVVGTVIGRDHQNWDDSLVDVLNSSEASMIVTTEKDAVKLRGLKGIRKQVAVVQLKVLFTSEFIEWLIYKLG